MATVAGMSRGRWRLPVARKVPVDGSKISASDARSACPPAGGHDSRRPRGRSRPPGSKRRACTAGRPSARRARTFPLPGRRPRTSPWCQGSFADPRRPGRGPRRSGRDRPSEVSLSGTPRARPSSDRWARMSRWPGRRAQPRYRPRHHRRRRGHAHHAAPLRSRRCFAAGSSSRPARTSRSPDRTAPWWRVGPTPRRRRRGHVHRSEPPGAASSGPRAGRRPHRTGRRLGRTRRRAVAGTLRRPVDEQHPTVVQECHRLDGE